MGKHQEVYDAELHAICRAYAHTFPGTPRPEDCHLRRRPGSLTEDHIRRTRPRTAVRSRDRTVGCGSNGEYTSNYGGSRPCGGRSRSGKGRSRYRALCRRKVQPCCAGLPAKHGCRQGRTLEDDEGEDDERVAWGGGLGRCMMCFLRCFLRFLRCFYAHSLADSGEWRKPRRNGYFGIRWGQDKDSRERTSILPRILPAQTAANTPHTYIQP